MGKQKTIEDRIATLEKFRDWAKPTIVALAKQLELSSPQLNPDGYCKDDLDRKIVLYLIEHEAAGSTEIAKALELERPKISGRHTIGKRIRRMERLSRGDGWNILKFRPEMKDGKFRAWWLNLEEIDIEAFKKSMEKRRLS